MSLLLHLKIKQGNENVQCHAWSLKNNHPNRPFWSILQKRTPKKSWWLVHRHIWGPDFFSWTLLTQALTPSPVSPFTCPAFDSHLKPYLLPCIYTKKGVTHCSRHNADYLILSVLKTRTFSLVVFKVYMIGCHSIGIWKYFFPIIKIWKLHLYLVIQPLQHIRTSGQLTFTSKHQFPLMDP